MKPYEGSDPFIFVSYAHADDVVVLPIIEALDAAGYRVWYDAGIKVGAEFPEYIATHIDRCQCMLAFLSSASSVSAFCDREIYRAFKTKKSIVPVYLDDSKPNAGTELLLDLNQALFRTKFESEARLAERLLRESIFKDCLREDAIEKRKAIAAARDALSSSSVDERSLDGALSALRSLKNKDKDVGQYASRIEDRRRKLSAERGLRRVLPVLREIQDVDRSQESRIHVGQVEGCLYWLEDERKRLIREERARMEAEVTQEAEEDLREEEARKDEAAKRAVTVTPKDLGEYSWAELKLISTRISAAGSDEEGLEIAKHFRLVGSDGRLGGETIQLMRDGKSWGKVRIVGFRHDELADGNGRKAGITFEFADIPVAHVMNSTRTNAGGWTSSEMHEYLNGDFLKLLPEDLRSNIVTVVKEANNTGRVSKDADVSKVVSGKADDV